MRVGILLGIGTGCTLNFACNRSNLDAAGNSGSVPISPNFPNGGLFSTGLFAGSLMLLSLRRRAKI